MKQIIKKILILFPLTLLLSGCFGGLAALSKLGHLHDAFLSFMGIFRIGRVSSQNPEATGQIIFMILLIGGIAVLLYYFSKKRKNKPITNRATATTIETKQENKAKENLSWDETPKVEEKKTQPQQETAGVKIGYWLAKNLENFKDPKTLKNKTLNEKKNQEKITEIKKDAPKEKLSWDEPLKKEEKKEESKKEKPKEVMSWDEPTKPEPKKEEPVKEEPKSTEVTITPQEEEEIYEQVAKELKENRSEGVWLKAYTENDGDETKTKIAYTKKRVNLLIEELKIKKQT